MSFARFAEVSFRGILPDIQAQERAQVQFPDKRPNEGNFNRPAPYVDIPGAAACKEL